MLKFFTNNASKNKENCFSNLYIKNNFDHKKEDLSINLINYKQKENKPITLQILNKNNIEKKSISLIFKKNKTKKHIFIKSNKQNLLGSNTINIVTKSISEFVYKDKVEKYIYFSVDFNHDFSKLDLFIPIDLFNLIFINSNFFQYKNENSNNQSFESLLRVQKLKTFFYQKIYFLLHLIQDIFNNINKLHDPSIRLLVSHTYNISIILNSFNEVKKYLFNFFSISFQIYDNIFIEMESRYTFILTKQYNIFYLSNE